MSRSVRLRRLVDVANGSLLVALFASGLVGAGLFGMACSSTDPGAVDYLGPLPVPKADATVNNGDDTVDSGGDDTTQDATMVVTDAADAMVMVPVNAFTGAGAYDASGAVFVGDRSKNPNHEIDGGAANGDTYGLDCLKSGCHAIGGLGLHWIFGGSVAQGGSPAESIEVRMVLPDGDGGYTLISDDFSDQSGNFWHQADLADSGFPAGVLVGVRSPNGVSLMTETLDGTKSCNNVACHGTGSTQAVITVP